MLQQYNFQMPKSKKRKLYTPLSDEDENFEIETTTVKDSAKVSHETLDNCIVKSKVKAQKINEIRVKELDPDEIEENLSWEMIKPMLRKDAVLLKSIWQHFLRFNPADKANKVKQHKKPEKDQTSFNQILYVLMTRPGNTKEQNCKQQINESFINSEKSGHSSKNQLNSVAEIRQPVNGFSIKAISSVVPCSDLNSIFTQHEVSKENQNIEQINSSIKDDFIGSQFIKSRMNVEDETTTNSVNHTKPLIDSNQILNEWLRNSPQNKLQLVNSDEDIPKTSLLSKSGKKIHHESLFKCFL